jgi:AAA family ATP:ADP antiporter
MDTVVFRGGDALTVWLDGALTALGLGFAGLAAALVPTSLGWTALTTWLARTHHASREPTR